MNRCILNISNIVHAGHHEALRHRQVELTNTLPHRIIMAIEVIMDCPA